MAREEAVERARMGAGAMLQRGPVLPTSLLEVTKLRDANAEEPSKAVVNSVSFHPSGQLLLTAGLDKRLRFFQASFLVSSKSLLARSEMGP